jgi:hypothetical protein
MKQQGITELSTGLIVERELKNGVLTIKAYTQTEWEVQWWQKAKQTITNG